MGWRSFLLEVHGERDLKGEAQSEVSIVEGSHGVGVPSWDGAEALGAVDDDVLSGRVGALLRNAVALGRTDGHTRAGHVSQYVRVRFGGPIEASLEVDDCAPAQSLGINSADGAVSGVSELGGLVLGAGHAGGEGTCDEEKAEDCFHRLRNILLILNLFPISEVQNIYWGGNQA